MNVKSLFGKSIIFLLLILNSNSYAQSNDWQLMKSEATNVNNFLLLAETWLLLQIAEQDYKEITYHKAQDYN
ncbi:MAG: hypothetical protein QNL61_04665 [Crocinitomicaceae bacterium]